MSVHQKNFAKKKRREKIVMERKNNFLKVLFVGLFVLLYAHN